MTRPAMLDDSAAEALAIAETPIFPALVLAPTLHLIKAPASAARADLIRSQLSWRGPLRETLLEHLAGLTAALGPLLEVRIVERGDHTAN